MKKDLITKKGESKMKLKNSLMFLSSLMLFAVIGCSSDDDDDDGVALIDTPTEYSFESRFSSGESSVSYSGQVVRNLLINDIKTQMGADAGSGDATTLLSMMANDNANQAILSSAGDMSTVQTKYHDISTSHLNDRLTAVESYIIPGYDANAGTLVNGWVQECVANGKTRANGVRLDQITQKTLWGAVSYWQATSKYMSKIPNDDNSMQSGDANYTAMEHHWDESFGYFGAALDYNTGYSDDVDRKSGPYNDSNSDGSIDFKSEYNVGWAVTAAKRDDCSACDTNYDFTKTIFDAYLEGRTLITNQADLADILVQRDLVMNTWEKVVAAVSIHYVNDVVADIAGLIGAGDATVAPGSDATADYENHWGEMRGYANGLLYNDFKLISDANLNRILQVMGTAPVYPSDGNFDAMQAYHDSLVGEVRAIFKASYGFSDANLAGW
tara:strand:- start:1075 stop:2397 length:1323 start_codon:yes stop_codon:yes gene_type:complete